MLSVKGKDFLTQEVSFVKLVSDFYHTYSPPPLYLFLKIHEALQDGDTEC